MRQRSPLVVLAWVVLALAGCVRLNRNGSRSTADAAIEAAPSDGAGDPGRGGEVGAAPDAPAGADGIATPDAAADADAAATPDAPMGTDAAAPLDGPAGGDAATDATPPDCTPRTFTCTTDQHSTRACTEDGRWGVTSPCLTDTICSGGLCLCSPGTCDEGLVKETAATGPLQDLAAGDRFLFLSTSGPLASIRRFDLGALPVTESVVTMGSRGVTIFAVDSDLLGIPIWCSTAVAGNGAAPVGQVMYGDRSLDVIPCTHVRRHANLVYYKGDVLYRRALDASTPAETVTRAPLDTFEIAGDFLYFVSSSDATRVASLGRISLTDPSLGDTLLNLDDSQFSAVMPDASHVYVIEEGRILRVPQVPAAQAVTFWQEAGRVAEALAQTDSHVYWTATTPSQSGSSCTETQVFRQPKAGGPVDVLARAPGYCAGPLVVVGDRLYTAMWGGVPSVLPTKIIRTRL